MSISLTMVCSLIPLSIPPDSVHPPWGCPSTPLPQYFRSSTMFTEPFGVGYHPQPHNVEQHQGMCMCECMCVCVCRSTVCLYFVCMCLCSLINAVFKNHSKDGFTPN